MAASPLDLKDLLEPPVVLGEAAGVGDGAPDFSVGVLDDGEPCGDVDPGPVASVGVVDEDSPEAVVDEASGYVEEVVEEGLPLDVDASGEVCVVGAVAVGARGHEDDVLGDPFCCSPRDLPGEGHVGAYGEVVAVVLYGRGGDEDYPVLLCDLLDLGPGHLVVQELLDGQSGLLYSCWTQPLYC